MKRVCAVGAIVVFLSGCSIGGNLPAINRQVEQGLTRVGVEFNEDGSLKEILITDGKAHQDVKAEYIKPDGTIIRYSSKSSDGSVGAISRADVEKTQAGEASSAVKDVVPGLLEKILE